MVPDKRRMEIIAIEILSSINQIVNKVGIANVMMIGGIEAMVSIDGMTMID